MDDHVTKSSNFTYWVFFGILGFVAIYFPFFGTSVRYQIGNYFSGFFDIILQSIGAVLFVIGSLTFVFGLFGLICGRSARSLKIMVMGFLLLMVGAFCSGYNFLMLFEGTDARPPPRGYT